LVKKKKEIQQRKRGEISISYHGARGVYCDGDLGRGLSSEGEDGIGPYVEEERGRETASI